jgi:hypothetical protein
MNILMLAISVLASFVTVFMRGFQHKNVIGGHKKLAFTTSYFIAAGEALCITLIVKGGWIIILTSGTGAAFGIITSMYVHDRFVKQHKN